ncbi:MAG: hypothetical protein DRI69_09145 [Bacteroidetes bacterium]|nr:MAG: hypothetical protein DRI69_09145 [Bacteroidota bacterium]
MKKSSLILALIFGIFAITTAQIREEKLNMILGVNNALIIEIPEADKSYVEKEWRDFMKKYGKVSKVKKTSQWLIQSANLVNYADIGRVSIYAEALDKAVPTELAAWIQVEAKFINSTDNPEAYDAAVVFLSDFALKVKTDLINIELEQHQKVLDKYQSNLTRLESSHDKYVSTVDKAHKDVATAEDGIVKNQQDQESTMADIEAIQDDPANEKQLKKLQKKQRGLESDYLTYVNNIAKNKDRITLGEGNIEENLTDQEAVKVEIEEQKLVVKEVRDRLDAVRNEKSAAANPDEEK